MVHKLELDQPVLDVLLLALCLDLEELGFDVNAAILGVHALFVKYFLFLDLQGEIVGEVVKKFDLFETLRFQKFHLLLILSSVFPSRFDSLLRPLV